MCSRFFVNQGKPTPKFQLRAPSCVQEQGAQASDLPLITELAGEAVQVVDVLLRSHHHLEGRDELAAGSTVPRHAKQPVWKQQQAFTLEKEEKNPHSWNQSQRLVMSSKTGPGCVGSAEEDMNEPSSEAKWMKADLQGWYKKSVS